MLTAAHSLIPTNKKFKLRAIDNLVRGAAPGDIFVFYCELLRQLSSSVDHSISIDAGHGDRLKNDVGGGGNNACACKYNFSRRRVFWPSN